MTVDELRELLTKYDGDRTVYVGGFSWWEAGGVRSIEPAGGVLIVFGRMMPADALFAGERTSDGASQ